MEIRKNITGDEQEFLVSGRIDGDGANKLELEILAAVKSGAKAIYVNLSEATFLCSAGIRVLLQYWRQLKNNGKTLLVTRPSPEVDAALEMTGFKQSILEKV
jgi:anti-anti-sigma factor